MSEEATCVTCWGPVPEWLYFSGMKEGKAGWFRHSAVLGLGLETVSLPWRLGGVVRVAESWGCGYKDLAASNVAQP